jgi:carboxyl-terminal processing protease
MVRHFFRRLMSARNAECRRAGVLAAAQAAVAIAAAFTLAGCATLPKAAITPAAVTGVSPAIAEHNIRVFNAAWDLVNRKHFDPKYAGVDWEAAAAKFGPKAAAATNDKALYRAINEMLAELNDSHTHALSPAAVEERHTHQRARTGFNLLRIEDQWIVTDVVPDSPAAKAGIKVGWIVTALNGEPITARFDFRPKVGEEARWQFRDENGQAVEVRAVARTMSTAPQQIARELEGGVWYLRFDEFDGKDRRWLSAQLKAHATAPAVIIDLRRNPGGDTFSLGTAIGEFFDHSVDCGTFITRGGTRSVKNSWQLGSANYAGRVVILIDGATGSAAEIFSAVLQDHGRAQLVGRKSAGAVLASWFYHLPDGGELQLSREDYMAPKGRRIEGNGLEPDVPVVRTLADIRAGRDRDLEAALQLLHGGAVAAAGQK